MTEQSAAAPVQGAQRDVWRSSLILFTVMMLVAIWAFLLWGVRQARATALETSQRQLVTLAKGFGLQLEAMIADGVGAALAGARRMSPQQPLAEAQQQLDSLLTGGGYIRALFVVDGNQVVVAKRPGEHFEAAGNWPEQLSGRRGPTWVGEVLEHADGPEFPVATRAVQADGHEVWAGAWIGFRDLESVYADLRGSGAYVSAISFSGRILRRLPPQEGDQNNIDIRGSDASAQFRAAPQQSVTLLTMPQPDTGAQFQYAIYRVKRAPLLAVGARSVESALAAWRESRNARVLLLTATSLVVLALAVAVQLLMNRRWADLQALAEARHAQLQVRESLASGLLLAQDAERKRLANELHDGVGQTLSMLRNRIVQLRRTGLPAEAEPQAQAILDLATESIEDLRGVAYSLRPMHLEELGVTSALRDLLERVRHSSDVEIHARIEDVDDVVKGAAATHIYRVVQEGINNVLKHAAASNLWLDVIRDIAWVEISVRDDGVGLASAGPETRRGLGLVSIGERCRMLGATLTVLPNKPAGTILCLRLPVETMEHVSA